MDSQQPGPSEQTSLLPATGPAVMSDSHPDSNQQCEQRCSLSPPAPAVKPGQPHTADQKEQIQHSKEDGSHHPVHQQQSEQDLKQAQLPEQPHAATSQPDDPAASNEGDGAAAAEGPGEHANTLQRSGQSPAARGDTSCIEPAATGPAPGGMPAQQQTSGFRSGPPQPANMLCRHHMCVDAIYDVGHKKSLHVACI